MVLRPDHHLVVRHAVDPQVVADVVDAHGRGDRGEPRGQRREARDPPAGRVVLVDVRVGLDGSVTRVGRRGDVVPGVVRADRRRALRARVAARVPEVVVHVVAAVGDATVGAARREVGVGAHRPGGRRRDDVARDVGEQVRGPRRPVVEGHPAVRCHRDDHEVRNGLGTHEVEVRRRRPPGAVGVRRDVAGPRGAGHRHVEDDGRHPGRRHPRAPTDLQAHGRARTHRGLGGAGTRAGVEHALRRQRPEGAGLGRRPGQDVAEDVGHQVEGSRGPVLQRHPAVRVHLGDDEIRDGPAGLEVQVRGDGQGRTVGVHREVPALRRRDHGDVQDDGRHTGCRDAPFAADLQVDRGFRLDLRERCADTRAGVEDPRGRQRLERAGLARGAREEVALDVGDEVGGPAGPVVQGHLAVAADRGDDEVGHRLPRPEVEVRRLGQWRSVAVHGDVTVTAGVRDRHVEQDGRHPWPGRAPPPTRPRARDTQMAAPNGQRVVPRHARCLGSRSTHRPCSRRRGRMQTMKTMTCRQLGGACDLPLTGDTGDEVIKAQDAAPQRRRRGR